MAFTRSLALTLAITVTSTLFMQTQSQAMLAPTGAAQTAESVTSAADLQTIQSALESKVLKGKLHAMGLTDEEIHSRLSRLSEAQKHQLASQIRAVHPAGDILIGVLVLVVLVLLIIFLVKRI